MHALTRERVSYTYAYAYQYAYAYIRSSRIPTHMIFECYLVFVSTYEVVPKGVSLTGLREMHDDNAPGIIKLHHVFYLHCLAFGVIFH